MPFLFAAAVLGILWGGARSGWQTSAQYNEGQKKPLPPVQGFGGKRWVTWVVAWRGRKLSLGPHLVDAFGANEIERNIKVLRPGARAFRFVLDR